MPGVDGTWQVERLREIAGSEMGHAVQIMPPPSYLQALQYEGNVKPIPGLSSDVILVYKCRDRSSTSSLPIDVREEINSSLDASTELGGDPLPAPFDDDETDISTIELKQYQWAKGELNHYPLKIHDALNILNRGCDYLNDTSCECDVWCLVDGGVGKGAFNESKNGFSNGNGNHSVDASILDSSLSNGLSGTNTILKEKSRILVGVHATGEWWTRSFVESQGMCSVGSPEMDPEIMKKTHSDISLMPPHMMSVSVLCRYNIVGERLTSDVPPSATCASCVSLELEWRTPTISVPLQDVFARVLVQASVGHHSSPAHGLWKQLCVLQKLFEVLFTCWGNKSAPDMLPHLDPTPDETLDSEIPQESLKSRIRTLIMGGKQALQAQTANRRMSVAPSLLARQSVAPGRQSIAPSLLARQSMAPPSSRRQSIAPSLLGRQSIAPGAHRRQSMAPGFLDRMAPQVNEETNEDGEADNKAFSLSEVLDLAATGNRDNSDLTDGLFSLLSECKTYHELVNAWDLIFMELNEAPAPFIRPKNSTRAAKLIQGFISGQVDSTPNFMEIEGSLFPLELLLELGMEKLTTDYYYVFSKSKLAGRDELQDPQLIRPNLGVPKEKWLASCGQLLGWLAQVHCALEMTLPLEAPMTKITIQSMASKALKHFQSENSPIRSVEALLTPGNSIQEFNLPITPAAIQEHVNRDFDWWRMTLVSENESMRVKTVFLRSHQRPIFPPQLFETADSDTSTKDIKSYYCAEAVTISQKL
ncbi:uncharacterized protein LOC117641410 [Thrips palmi]|uniref:Protein zwilch n=1 Tax=Thrips palmi TaxID=161013 RepID=A0A6P8YKT8_THRPL|nr:uncharacterized protein LOC117641410 [Thrips palmi]